ncbi:hypothetical protein BU16DRAFT_555885 [Lophium mytilinum]|uniref:Uncharacterized protein n=1 Tax=Lophium mytilinum TaxID=390894 RepID=A0A6A6RD91_9PEZI|nr:hypothetical protein BU16DRAFT_555885 [Lophium mytilinum]
MPKLQASLLLRALKLLSPHKATTSPSAPTALKQPAMQCTSLSATLTTNTPAHTQPHDKETRLPSDTSTYKKFPVTPSLHRTSEPWVQSRAHNQGHPGPVSSGPGV